MSGKFFEAGKTYIENEPYRAPEALGVFKVEWVGTPPNDPTFHIAMGFTTEAFPGEEWRILLESATDERMANPDYNFEKKWVEDIWNTTENDYYWRPMTPGDNQ